LVVEPAAPDAVVSLDPSQFEAAILNLAVNARDATPPGGMIRIETTAVSLAAGQVAELEPGDYLRVSVHDTGVGMDEATIARAFLKAGEPFDLLLTDLIMPGDKSGVDLAREAVALRPELPVLLSSGYTGDVLSLAEETPWPLLRKPYGPDQLARAIAEAVPP